MDNKPLRPPTPTEGSSVAASRPDSGDEIGVLRATHAIAGNSSADTQNPSPPSSPSLGSAAALPGQRTLSQLGDYLLFKKIASGAMGAVYTPPQLRTKRALATKVLS